jgi:hypothetical protein
MKRVIVLFCLFAFYSISQAQIGIPKVNSASGASALLKDFVKPPAIGDIAGTSTGITDLLSSKLSLPGTQKPGLSDAISGFLTSKKGITGLAGSNPTSYLAKFNPLQKGLFGKMKGIMGASAFTKFLGLKPSGSNIAGNALSHLFF